MTDNAPLISVLMAAKDASRYIVEAIDSIRRQSVDDWELIVVDDASTDDTPRIVSELGADGRIKLVRREVSGGPYVAANTGLPHVRGRYVARLDSDDICIPDRFEKQLRFLEARPGLRGCMGEVQVMMDETLMPFGPREIPTLPGAVMWGLAARAFFPSTAMFETSALRELGGYNELYASQDHRMWCEFARQRWLGTMTDILVYWRMHERQLSGVHYDLQQELGASVVAEHLEKISGEPWTTTEAHAIRYIGAMRSVALRPGERVLRKYEQAWKQDATLSVDERAELERLTKALRVSHRKEWLRDVVSRSTIGRTSLRAYTRLHARSQPR